MHDMSNHEEWRRIAEKITRETDHDKLIELVQQLIKIYDSRGKVSATSTQGNSEPSRVQLSGSGDNL